MQPSWQRSLLLPPPVPLPPVLLPSLPAVVLPVPEVLPWPLSSSSPQPTTQQPSTNESIHANEALIRLTDTTLELRRRDAWRATVTRFVARAVGLARLATLTSRGSDTGLR